MPLVNKPPWQVFDMSFSRKLPFLVFLAALVLCFILLFKLRRFGDLGPIACIVGLAIVFIWGEVGSYPFEGRQQLRNHVPLLAAMLVLCGIGNGSLTNGPAPVWYPTDNTEWIIVPWFLFGLACVVRGYRVLPRQPAAANSPSPQVPAGTGGSAAPGSQSPTALGQRIGFFAFIIGLVIWLFLLVNLRLVGEIGPLIVAIGLATLFVFAELGRYPFFPRQKIGNRLQYYAALTLILSIAISSLNEPAASWYPTANPEWVVLPVLLYGIASALRGLRP